MGVEFLRLKQVYPVIKAFDRPKNDDTTPYQHVYTVNQTIPFHGKFSKFKRQHCTSLTVYAHGSDVNMTVHVHIPTWSASIRLKVPVCFLKNS